MGKVSRACMSWSDEDRLKVAMLRGALRSYVDTQLQHAEAARRRNRASLSLGHQNSVRGTGGSSGSDSGVGCAGGNGGGARSLEHKLRLIQKQRTVFLRNFDDFVAASATQETQRRAVCALLDPSRDPVSERRRRARRSLAHKVHLSDLY